MVDRRSSNDRVTDELLEKFSMVAAVVDKRACGPLCRDQLFAPVGCLGCN